MTPFSSSKEPCFVLVSRAHQDDITPKLNDTINFCPRIPRFKHKLEVKKWD
jgi:hypothetical protein